MVCEKVFVKTTMSFLLCRNGGKKTRRKGKSRNGGKKTRRKYTAK